MSIIAIWGAPHSGKTTLAIDLAHALSQHGRSACLISPEPYSELSGRMNMKIPKSKSLAAALEAPGSLKQTVQEAAELLYVLAAAWDTDAFADEPSLAAIRELLKQAEAVFDTVLVDCPSGNGNAFAAQALRTAASVILLSGSDTSAAMWYSAYRRPIAVLDAKTFFVCNQTVSSYDYLAYCKAIRMIPALFLPHFPDISSIQTAKRTVYGSSSKAGRAYTEGLNEILKKLEVHLD